MNTETVDTVTTGGAIQTGKTASPYLPTARRLHQYMVANHWKGQALVGPDPGVRFNYRIGRFVKSYLSFVPWNDDLYYLQGQGYWILGNLTLAIQTGQPQYKEIAIDCAATILKRQRADGAWDYPNPEWKGRVATAEGTWAALGLLQLYRQTLDEAYLAAALRWHKYLVNTIGFQQSGDELAINYFAHRDNDRVPNNSITVLRFLAELADVTGDASYRQHIPGLLAFIRRIQKKTGEFPYAVGGAQNPTYCRSHFQCYQYNAFECINLIRYSELTGDSSLLATITRLADFLCTGLAKDGHAFYQCDNRHGAVTYHAAALGAALLNASCFGIPGCEPLARRAYTYVVNLQRADGGLIHSRRDYHVLSDRRSYPRYLAMILYHLLLPEISCMS